MLTMADSTTVANLPDGYDAYLGYGNGIYNTTTDLKVRFPGKPLVILSVTGEPIGCNGVDIERGDYNAATGVNAALTIINVKPVLYASVAGNPGSGMNDVLNALRATNTPRERVRLMSAHYNYVKHICGPSTCNSISIPMDGTQYTNAAFGNNSSSIDASVLNDNFFDANKKEEYMLVKGSGPGVYFLSGGKMAPVQDEQSLNAIQSSGVALVTVSDATLNAWLTAFPPGNPVVEVGTITFPAADLTGTITPKTA